MEKTAVMSTSKKKASPTLLKLTMIAASILFYIMASRFPTPEGLTIEGQKSIVLMLIAIFWWVFEIIPVGISTLLFTMMVGFLGITSTSTVMGNFFSATIIFIISALVIGKVFIDVGLGERISLYVSTLFGKKSENVLLSFMLPTAIVSSVLVDIPTAIIFASIAYGILQNNNCKPGESNFGKAMMMGIPIAAALGGFGTPAGSGINVLAITLMKQVAGVELGFLQWTMIGFPMAIILTFFAWFVLIKLYPPEFDEVNGLENVKKKREELPPLNKNQYTFIVIFGATIIGWFTGILPVPIVSILAATLFFIPGINLVKWKDMNAAIPWDVLLLIGASQSLGLAIYETGGAEWIANSLLHDIGSASTVVLLFAVTAFGIFSHLILPVASAVLTVCIPVIAILAESNGLPVSMVVLPIAFTASCVFLMPLDPVPLTTKKYGYWQTYEMPVPGFIVSIAWLIVNVGAMLLANSIGII